LNATYNRFLYFTLSLDQRLRISNAGGVRFRNTISKERRQAERGMRKTADGGWGQTPVIDGSYGLCYGNIDALRDGLSHLKGAICLQYVHHQAIGARNIENSVDFDTRFMGYRRIPRPDLGFPGAWLKLGNAQLHLIGKPGEHPDENGLPRGIHPAYQTENMDGLIKMEKPLMQMKIQYRRVIQRDSGTRQIFFRARRL
jgi:glyoxylase I family protein